MIRKLIVATAFVLLIVTLAGCGTDLGTGMIKELKDNEDGIRQELGDCGTAS